MIKKKGKSLTRSLVRSTTMMLILVFTNGNDHKVSDFSQVTNLLNKFFC